MPKSPAAPVSQNHMPRAVKEGIGPASASSTFVKVVANYILSYVVIRTDRDIVRSHELLQLFAKAGAAVHIDSTEGNRTDVLFLKETKAVQFGMDNLIQARKYIAARLLQVVEGKYEKGAAYRGYDNQLFQRIIHEEVAALSATASSIFAVEMKNALRLLGAGLEHSLANMAEGAVIKESELLSLKPLLLKLLNESQPSSVRDNAEQLLNKITAQQILSQSSGPIQHVITQFPISFHRFQTEATMQWSGRKKQNGRIDPAFCRVLFYLELENMKETVIDLVVQNKIMKITVINEKAPLLKSVSQLLIQQLKERLEGLAIRFLPFFLNCRAQHCK